MHKKSKAAFEHNIKAEMEAGKPQKQSLAIAYSVKRKAKKMANGGSIKDEKRPVPDQAHNDKAEVSRNSGNKPAMEDSWTSRPDMKQSQKGPRMTAIKHPKMVPQDGYSVRLRDQEDDLQDSAKVNDGPQRQPPEQDNEDGADRQGPKVPDMQRQHSDGRKAYAKGGPVSPVHKESAPGMSVAGSKLRSGDIDGSRDEHHAVLGKMNADKKRPLKGLYEGGIVSEHDAEEDMAEHPAGLESDDDMMSPPEDEFMAGHFADGGMVDNEEEIEHAASIAAAIMSMNRRKMAEGGEVNGHDSIYAHPEEDQADLSRNAEEDANMEDQSSFGALRKENYSESEGLEALDQPHDSNMKGDSREDSEENIHDGDIVSAIRRKMKIKSAISR